MSMPGAAGDRRSEPDSGSKPLSGFDSRLVLRTSGVKVSSTALLADSETEGLRIRRRAGPCWWRRAARGSTSRSRSQAEPGPVRFCSWMRIFRTTRNAGERSILRQDDPFSRTITRSYTSATISAGSDAWISPEKARRTSEPHPPLIRRTHDLPHPPSPRLRRLALLLLVPAAIVHRTVTPRSAWFQRLRDGEDGQWNPIAVACVTPPSATRSVRLRTSTAARASPHALIDDLYRCEPVPDTRSRSRAAIGKRLPMRPRRPEFEPAWHRDGVRQAPDARPRRSARARRESSTIRAIRGRRPSGHGRISPPRCAVRQVEPERRRVAARAPRSERPPDISADLARVEHPLARTHLRRRALERTTPGLYPCSAPAPDPRADAQLRKTRRTAAGVRFAWIGAPRSTIRSSSARTSRGADDLRARRLDAIAAQDVVREDARVLRARAASSASRCRSRGMLRATNSRRSPPSGHPSGPDGRTARRC